MRYDLRTRHHTFRKGPHEHCVCGLAKDELVHQPYEAAPWNAGGKDSMSERLATLLAWCAGFVCGTIVGLIPFICAVVRRMP